MSALPTAIYALSTQLGSAVVYIALTMLSVIAIAIGVMRAKLRRNFEADIKHNTYKDRSIRLISFGMKNQSIPCDRKIKNIERAMFHRTDAYTSSKPFYKNGYIFQIFLLGVIWLNGNATNIYDAIAYAGKIAWWIGYSTANAISLDLIQHFVSEPSAPIFNDNTLAREASRVFLAISFIANFISNSKEIFNEKRVIYGNIFSVSYELNQIPKPARKLMKVYIAENPDIYSNICDENLLTSETIAQICETLVREYESPSPADETGEGLSK